MADPATAARASKRDDRALRGSPAPAVLLWRAAAPGRWTWADPAWSSLTGQATSAALDHGWLDRVHPGDRASTLEAWRAAEAAGRFVDEHRFLDMAGAGRWFRCEAAPVRDAAGGVIEWLGASTEIGLAPPASERERDVVAELQRRTRNMVAVIRSVARRTSQTSESLEAFAAHFEGRLDALSRTHLLLAPGAGADLQGLVRDEALAQAGPQAEIEATGPDLHLFGRTAELIAQALHELATNAVKFGALSSGGGTVAVTWRVAGPAPGRLQLEWRETGVRVLAAAPRRRAFGAELIEQRLAYEIGGAGEIVFRAGGVTCVIEAPLGPGCGTLAPAEGLERSDRGA